MQILSCRQINDIFEQFSERNPQPKTELNYNNNYSLLVAVVLSAQATDVSVNKATKDLFKLVSTPQDMLDLGIVKLEQYIKTIGLWREKAKNIILLSKSLVDNFNGNVPNNLTDLMSLAGVGRKTANVVLNTAFGQNTIAVDTHIFRLSRRLGLSDGSNPLAVEKDLLRAIPDKYIYNAHHWLVLHGRYICKARKPLCNECFLTKICLYYKNNNIDI
ncbi:endonuclease III [Bartonella sp. DGB1]|uniref:endonuclease III n=1 Tax=Bartonella sp. DGB1 TaxID=3239807 RepID=UPI0035248349